MHCLSNILALLAMASLIVGCRGPACQAKTCRVVPDIKKTTTSKFVVETEDICLPGCSRRFPVGSCPGCGEVACRGECGGCVQPACGRIITKKKLKRVTESVEKPGFKCVVVNQCPPGEANCETPETPEIPAGVTVPAPPAK